MCERHQHQLSKVLRCLPEKSFCWTFHFFARTKLPVLLCLKLWFKVLRRKRSHPARILVGNPSCTLFGWTWLCLSWSWWCLSSWCCWWWSWLCQCIHDIFLFSYSVPFEVVAFLEELFSPPWFWLEPPRLHQILTLVSRVPHKKISALRPKKSAFETEQPSPLFARRKSASYWAIFTNANHYIQRNLRSHISLNSLFTLLKR